MIAVNKHGVILEKRNVDFEQEGVLNPAVYYDGKTTHMFYRAVAKGNHSTIGYCELKNPLEINFQLDFPVIKAEEDYESQGVEDPRIVKIDGQFYLSYSGYDGNSAFGCVATSYDLQHFEKKGIVVPQFTGDELRNLLKKSDAINIKYFQPSTGNSLVWNKNLVFFPRRIDGKLMFLQRIRPGIQIVSCDELSDLTKDFWIDYMTDFSSNILLDPKYNHELSYIGSGCPPIETDQGWLLIYHGVHDTINGYEYVACAALLDLENPHKEITRLSRPLFKPDRDYEMKGYVNHVCFPTGTALIDDTLYIYYGAADERIACASVSLSELLEELLK